MNRLNNQDIPLHCLIFALLVLHMHVVFSSEPSLNLL